MLRADVAIVGAGPAGMSAALAAADAGADVTLIDELPRAGGQYFKRVDKAFEVAPPLLTREHSLGERFRSRIEEERIRLLPNTIVWGVFDDKVLMLYDGSGSTALSARALVLATGAHDRPVPFPGWTLPGVVTAGGAQTLAKTQWVMPGKRVLLAGAGPFLLPVAQNLILAGTEVVAILDATTPLQWWRVAAAARNQWHRYAEAGRYARTIRRAGVPIRFGHKIIAATGDKEVETATIARVDRSWRAVPDTETSVRVDAVATGYGFLPSLELAAHCGCALRWDADGQSWFADVDAKMETSRSGIFAAGEILGIGGAAPAMEEGRIAGLSAAEHAGRIAGPEAERRRNGSVRRRRNVQRFADTLNRVFRPRPGLWEGMTDATTICRCEEVTAGEVRQAINSGCASLKEIKDWTRAGMGPCQGRICRSLISILLSRQTGTDLARVRFPSIRPPIKPVPLAALATTEIPEAVDNNEELEA